MTAPDVRFRQVIATNLTYWQAQIGQLKDGRKTTFSEEQSNVILAVELGLALPATQEKTAELLLLIYPHIERCGHWQRWLSLFERTTSLDLTHAPLLCARLLNRQGQLFRLLQQSERALALHQQAERLAQASDSQQAQAEIWFNLSIDYWQGRAYEQADAYGQKALAIFCALPDGQRWQASMLNTLGLIALHQGHLATAQTRLHQSVALWQQFDEPTELARVFNNLGNVCYEQDQLEAALHYYHQALEQLIPTESALDRAEVLTNMGALYFRWEQYDKAETVLRQANSPALRRSGYFHLQALMAQNLGNTLLKQNQVAEAEKHLRQSEVVWLQLGNDLMLANTVGTLAEVLTEQGQYETAVAHYDDALRLLEKFPTNSWAKSLKEEFVTGKSAIERLLIGQEAGGHLNGSDDRQ